MASRSSGDTTKTATTTAVHHPFYSPIIHSALQQLANQTAASQRTETIASSRPIANRVESSDDESNEIGRAATATDDNSSDSDDESSSDEEEEEAPSEEPLLADQLMASAPIISNKANKRSSKKSRVKKLNNPPCIVLPLHQEDNKTENHDDLQSNNNQPNQYPLALSIPTILLPNNYLRDNPNYDSSQVASHLLSAWTALHRGIHSNNSNSSSSSPNTDNNNNNNRSTILIILLQSGRFASAVYTLQNNHNQVSMQMLTHKTSTRYTVRKGQGGSQSTKDSSSKKPKSMGAQLRREGERQLRNDVVSTWKEWKRLGYLNDNVCVGVWMSVPKVMRKEYLFDDVNEENALLLDKNDERIRSIPLDYGRPTLEAVEAVMECLMRCEVGPMRDVNVEQHYVDNDNNDDVDRITPVDKKSNGTSTTETADAMHSMKEMEDDLPQVQAPPYTPLHEAVLAGDLTQVTELLKQQHVEQTTSQDKSKQSTTTTFIDTRAGPEYSTPLHLASSSTHTNTWMILNTLLIQGRANPCILDSHGRPPYYLASSDKVREAFRVARHKLGEDYCDWESSKIGPALSPQDIENKRIKALEKKKRQRAKQKEKKAMEAEAEAKAKKEEEEKAARLKKEDDAKRIRDGLQPKAVAKGNTCDFCQTSVKKKSSMFQRLQYYYCSTDCVKRHQRELAAAAATARLGK